MVRARLAHLGLATTLLWVSGCVSSSECCHSGGWGNRFGLASRTVASSDCEGCGAAGLADGPIMAGPSAPGFTTPPSTLTMPTTVTPGPQGTPPRIVPVPQANPMPYSPQ